MASQNEVTALVRAFYSSSRARLDPTALRSIAPICSALEAHNHKRALLLADQLLKKSPADPAALALKAVALSISSRPLSSSTRSDILKVVETAKKVNGGAALGDADVLMLFNHVLRAVGRGDDALELLAKAVQRNPNNEELSMEAFLQYVRANDRKSAQQISMRMAKQFQDERYFWWSILSTILLVRDLAHPQGALLLSLAERQLSTRYAGLAAPADGAIAEGEQTKGYNSADEFHLVTRFLELRAQYAAAAPASTPATPTAPALVLPSLPCTDAPPSTPAAALLAHFASPEADKWCATNLGLELWRREAELEYGSGENGTWERSVERLRGALEKGDTNWHTMLYLIRTSVALASSTSSSAPAATGLAHLARAKDLFRELATDGPKARVERGYLLALVELVREGQVRGWAQSDKLGPLVQEYFERFAGKACCFDDLFPYLEVLGAEDVEALTEPLQAAAGGAVQTIAAATKVINAHKVLRYLAPEPTLEGEQADAEEFVRRYFEVLPLGRDLPPTELQPADDFALLAGQAFVSAFHLAHDRSHLERALIIAEHALQRSKYKYQLRILAINLLRLLGASSASLAHYRVFGVKNIQHDTLSHLVLARGATFAIEQGGGRADAGVWEEMLSTEAWYAGGRREAREMVVKAFSYGAFGKVEDFTAFRERLDASLQGGLVALEAVRMTIVRGQIDADEVDEAVEEVAKLVAAAPDAYSDNRDFKTLPNYQRKGSAPIWEQTELAARQDSAWLHTLAGAYSRFLAPSTNVPTAELPPSLSRSEAALVSFSQRAQTALLASLDDAPEKEQAAVAFFKEQGELLVSALDDPRTLPWELVQIAEVALEAFALLELGITQRQAELAAQKAPDQAKHQKRLRAFRNAAREPLKALGVKLTAYGKKVGKDRARFVASSAGLSEFEALDENRITNVAHAVTESRRSAIEALGSAIHRRTAK
ncbi:mitochondrial distribution and morphology [Rhodotorula kratochvilovae]